MGGLVGVGVGVGVLVPGSGGRVSFGLRGLALSSILVGTVGCKVWFWEGDAVLDAEDGLDELDGRVGFDLIDSVLGGLLEGFGDAERVFGEAGLGGGDAAGLVADAGAVVAAVRGRLAGGS